MKYKFDFSEKFILQWRNFSEKFILQWRNFSEKFILQRRNLNINVLYSIGKGYKTQTRGIASLLKHRREASRLY